VVALLNAIYEEDFLGFSYGFRPGRGAHDAMDALCVGIHSKKVSFILDADKIIVLARSKLQLVIFLQFVSYFIFGSSSGHCRQNRAIAQARGLYGPVFYSPRKLARAALRPVLPGARPMLKELTARR